MPAFYIIFFILLLIYLALEYFKLKQIVQKIPVRILVNGTRGKSTTVRILYQILKENKYQVIAKTTGDFPEVIYPDGKKTKIRRFAPASIIENVALLRKWAKIKPNAVVMECMALLPENQGILTNSIFQPTHILLTNILNDHNDVMGENKYDIYRVITESFSDTSKIFLLKELDEFFEKYKNINYINTESFPVKFSNIPQAIIDRNWSLVKSFTEFLKFNAQESKRIFQQDWHQINESIKIKSKNLNFEFWNLFSVNDTDTAGQLFTLIKSTMPENSGKVLIFNTRDDRPLRTKQFVDLIKSEFRDAKINLCGDGCRLALRLLKGHKGEINKLVQPKDIISISLAIISIVAILFGVKLICKFLL